MPMYVVVGASRHLGFAFVRLLAADANNVVFALARDLADAPDLVTLSSNAPHKNVHILKLDLLNLQSIKDAAENVGKATGGSIDVLIHNGAIMYHPFNRMFLSSFTDGQELEDYMLHIFKANVIGTVHTLNAFLPFVLQGPTKRVLAITSQMGSPHWAVASGLDTATAYSISKAGLNMVVAKLAASEKNREAGLTIIGISPGFMKSLPLPDDIRDKWYEEELAKIKAVEPMYCLLDHEDSARQQLELLEQITPADSGTLMHWNGKKFI